jgi:uncharacterized protein (DUF2342 family)
MVAVAKGKCFAHKSGNLNIKGIMSAKNGTPSTFSKAVIGELAFVRATVQQLAETVMDDIAARTNVSKTALRNDFKARTDAKAKRFYDHYVKELGL